MKSNITLEKATEPYITDGYRVQTGDLETSFFSMCAAAERIAALQQDLVALRAKCDRLAADAKRAVRRHKAVRKLMEDAK